VAGVGVNYAALAWLTALLSRSGALRTELSGVDIPRELRRYGLLPFWVPCRPLGYDTRRRARRPGGQ